MLPAILAKARPLTAFMAALIRGGLARYGMAKRPRREGVRRRLVIKCPAATGRLATSRQSFTLLTLAAKQTKRLRASDVIA